MMPASTEINREIQREMPVAPERSKRALRLAYLTTEYPKVSHTFIRREILELERRGNHVMRLAIRSSGGVIADAADAKEEARTFHCLAQSKVRFIAAIALAIIRKPLKSLRALRMTVDMNRRSERGWLRHLAYWVEAALLLHVLKRERIEHVHVHFGTNAAGVARLIRCLGGPTYSLTVHGPTEFDAPIGFSLGRKIEDALFVIAISDYCAAQIRRWVSYKHWSKIHIVHCTVGEQFFDHSRPIHPDCHTLICIGRLTAAKAQLLIVDAAKKLVDAGVEIRLVLAGDGEMRSEIEARIAHHRLQSHVQITGWLDEAAVRKHLLEARALVQPSFAEGLPVVIMEAFALGRPVISTYIAGIPELVRNGENGWLIPASNIEELARVMREAIELPTQLVDAMGQSGRQCVRKHHFTVTEGGKLEAIFNHYLSKTTREDDDNHTGA